MHLHRFIGEFNLRNGPMDLDDPDLWHQAYDVLRLRLGDRTGLCDGKGMEALALADIVSFGRNKVQVNVKEVFRNAKEPNIRTMLCCAILKSDNFKLVAQKTTETGISEIVPLLTGRSKKDCVMTVCVPLSVRRPSNLARGILPVLHMSMTFSDAVRRANSHQAKLFFDAREQLLDML